MKYLIALIFVIFVSNYCISQEDYKFLEEMAAIKKTTMVCEAKYELANNKSKLVDSTVYSFNAANLITRIENGKSYSLPMKEFFYNTDNKVSRVESNSNGISYHDIYEYEFNKLISIKTYDKNNKLINNIKFYYDANGNLMKKSATLKKYTTTFLNFMGNIIRSEITNTTNAKKEIEYIYDNKGNLTTEKVFDSLKKSKNKRKYLKLKIEYSYDEYGYLKEKKIYLTDSVIEKIYYKYNEDGTLKEWKKVDPQGNENFITKYYY